MVEFLQVVLHIKSNLINGTPTIDVQVLKITFMKIKLKDSIISFIRQVDNTNKEYDKIQTLSNTLINAHEQ